MLPVQYIGVATGGVVGTVATFPVPGGANRGDVMVAVLATSSRSTAVGLTATSGRFGLTRLAVAETAPASSNGQVFVAARTVDGTEAAAGVRMMLTAAPANARAIVLLYRGLIPALTDVQAADVAASTSFTVPATTAARYSDLWLGVSYASSGVTFTAPASTAKRYDVAGATGLAVFDRGWDVTGAIASKLAVASSAASGIAAGFMLSAEGLRAVDKVIRAGQPATIGLPVRGV